MTGVPLPRLLGTFCLLMMVPVTVLASGEGLPSLVRDIGICIVLAGLLAIVFVRLKIPEIAAFLLAGVVVGPVGTGMVTDPGNIETISELGLILLLYLIGLEIDVRKLLDSGRIMVVSGLLQYPLCVAFGVAITKLLVGPGFGGELLAAGYAPLYVGFVVAASSTLLVVKLFQETFQLDTEVIARFIIPFGFKWVAKRPEFVFAASISWCFLIVLLGVYLDVLTNWLFKFDLHMSVGAEMGALIAGATIANLPYSTEIISKVSVVRDFFITLFFVGLGMSIPVPDGADVLMLAGLFAVLALLARYVVFFPLLYVTGLDRRNAMVTSVRLAQISEFSLVIGFIGVQLGQISGNLNSAIIFAFIITAMLTPLLFHQADAIHDRLSGILTRLGFREPPSIEADEEESYSLALLGFHRVASSLLHDLGKDHPELLEKTLVVDFNVNLHPKIAALGVTVKYGDLCSAETLHHAGVDKARVIACTIPDDVLKGTTNLKLVEAARHINPGAVIIANAIKLSDSRALYEAGADYVFLQRIETARAVEQAIEQALSGDIGEHRRAVEAQHGEWHAREEIM
jgi:Kef-type K+ transport system membrane component KefB